MKKKYRIIIFIVFVSVLISFLTTQLTNDFQPFWAYGRFVSNSDKSGIDALFDTWEMKGVLFKVYLAVSYTLTSHFSTLFDAYGQFVYKVIGIIPFLLLLLLAIYELPKSYHENFSKKELFCISSILLLATHFASHFQAEMWGVLLLLLSFSLYLHKGWKPKVMAAFIYTLTFYLKSPIPIMGGALVIGAVILKKQNVKQALFDLVPFAITTAIFLSLTLLFLYRRFPQEIVEMWNASYYQHTLFQDLDNLLLSLEHFIWHLLLSFLYTPIVTLGTIASFILLKKYHKDHDWLQCLLLCLVWLFPMAYILLSNHYFEYHYYLLAFSSMLILLILKNSGTIIKPKALCITSIIYLSFYLFVLSSVCPSNIYQRRYFAEIQKSNYEKYGYYVGCELGKDSVMYLDCGIGAFMFSNKSYLKYFYPLPLERIKATDEFAQTTTYKETKKKAMEYSGEYIVLQEAWFCVHGNNMDILEKIKKEYYLEKKVSIPCYPWSLFLLKGSRGVVSIYKRIEPTNSVD